ncbi:MAG: hypothetical protein ACO1RX_20010 [Candidatus Sericytochromatia bacterium]
MNQAQLDKSLATLNRLRTDIGSCCCGDSACRHQAFLKKHFDALHIRKHSCRIFDEEARGWRNVWEWVWDGPVTAEATISSPNAEPKAAAVKRPIDIASEMARQGAPATTPEACKRHRASTHSCSCPDRRNRGGSYTLDGRKVCKHMAAMRIQQQKAQQQAVNLKDPLVRLVAAAAQNGDGGLQQLAEQAAHKLGLSTQSILSALRVHISA